jgi:hypothetical protein
MARNGLSLRVDASPVCEILKDLRVEMDRLKRAEAIPSHLRKELVAFLGPAEYVPGFVEARLAEDGRFLIDAGPRLLCLLAGLRAQQAGA